MSSDSSHAKPIKTANHDYLTFSKPTILIVEDHDDTREMLSMLFKQWGCQVVEARDGREAVEVASRERPALILMDLSLPFLDGLDATRRIRESGHLGEVKIIALNGWGSASYNAAALAAGCDDCLVKPIDLSDYRTTWSRSSLGLP